ncbi:MAG: glycosyltransferase family 9 protein [Deltaproteobacteria bacterium]|nr:glycosyltransferase family 9 protein [Deltaproteobacteria bacterium]
MLARVLKRLIVFLIGLVSRARACPPGALASIAPARTLVVVSDERMGEILLAGPLIRALASTFPFSKIDLLLADRYAWIAGRLPGVKEAMPFRKRDFFRHPLSFIAFIQSLRARGYALAVDGGKDDTFSLTTALLMRASGAQIRLGHRRDVTPFLTLAVERGPDGLAEAGRRLNLTKAFGEKTFDAALRLNAVSDGRQALISTLQEARFKVGVYPGARKHDHRVPAKVLSAAVLRLTAKGIGVLVIPGVGDLDLCRSVAKKGGALLAPIAPGPDLCSLIRTCDLFIANDTGPMHLAVALGVPTLGLFVRGEAGRWGHSEPPHRAVFVGPTPSPEGPECGAMADRLARIALDMLGRS